MSWFPGGGAWPTWPFYGATWNPPQTDPVDKAIGFVSDNSSSFIIAVGIIILLIILIKGAK
jgi:hypothetical protein